LPFGSPFFFGHEDIQLFYVLDKKTIVADKAVKPSVKSIVPFNGILPG
jgi:hypothetical protein